MLILSAEPAALSGLRCRVQGWSFHSTQRHGARLRPPSCHPPQLGFRPFLFMRWACSTEDLFFFSRGTFCSNSVSFGNLVRFNTVAFLLCLLVIILFQYTKDTLKTCGLPPTPALHTHIHSIQEYHYPLLILQVSKTQSAPQICKGKIMLTIQGWGVGQWWEGKNKDKPPLNRNSGEVTLGNSSHDLFLPLDFSFHFDKYPDGLLTSPPFCA